MYNVLQSPSIPIETIALNCWRTYLSSFQLQLPKSLLSKRNNNNRVYFANNPTWRRVHKHCARAAICLDKIQRCYWPCFELQRFILAVDREKGRIS